MLEQGSLEKDKYEKGKTETEPFWKGTIKKRNYGKIAFEKGTNIKRNNLNGDSFEKEKSETGQLWKEKTGKWKL